MNIRQMAAGDTNVGFTPTTPTRGRTFGTVRDNPNARVQPAIVHKLSYEKKIAGTMSA